MFTIRRARERDLVHIPVLDRSCFPDDERIPVQDSEWWLVWYDGRPVGYAGFMKLDRYVGYLSRAGVLNLARGKGLQKRLIYKRLAYARSLGLRKAITYTLYDNWPSINSLISTGFKVYEPSYAWVGREKVIYWLRNLF